MLSRKDTAVLGMMVFALFLGAGNVIFPPMAGYQAGANWMAAALGFLLTGVGLPFLTLVVVASCGSGEALSRELPPWAATTFWTLLYLVIGPTFAMPRVINVAYQLGALPLGVADTPWLHFGFALAFGALGLFFMLRPGTLIDSVGRVMTPVLLLLLSVVAAGVIVSPLAPVPANAPAGMLATSGLGMVSGYQTMDVLGAMAFGALVARMLALKGITRRRDVATITLRAGLLSALLLSALYLCLFYLGASAGPAMASASNGGQILAHYVNALFGTAGSWVMAGIILLACLTTLVGVTSASADYFSKTYPGLNYIGALVLCSLATVLIANFGLDTLIRVTVPVLFLIYPPALTLVVLELVRRRLASVRLCYVLTLGVVCTLSLADALNTANLLPEAVQRWCLQLPLFAHNLGWLLPGSVVLLLSSRVDLFAEKIPARA